MTTIDRESDAVGPERGLPFCPDCGEEFWTDEDALYCPCEGHGKGWPRRMGLVLCEQDDEKVTVVMERIYERASSLRDEAEHEDNIQTFRVLVRAYTELEWAAGLLAGGCDE
jgi:hypothetical protein